MLPQRTIFPTISFAHFLDVARMAAGLLEDGIFIGRQWLLFIGGYGSYNAILNASMAIVRCARFISIKRRAFCTHDSPSIEQAEALFYKSLTADLPFLRIFKSRTKG